MYYEVLRRAIRLSLPRLITCLGWRRKSRVLARFRVFHLTIPGLGFSHLTPADFLLSDPPRLLATFVVPGSLGEPGFSTGEGVFP